VPKWDARCLELGHPLLSAVEIANRVPRRRLPQFSGGISEFFMFPRYFTAKLMVRFHAVRGLRQSQ